jgi:hypothetical protein
MSDRARRLLVGVFVLGVVGISLELLLLGHDEDAWQAIPLALAGLALPSVVVVAVSRSAAWIYACRTLMGLFILSGVVGAGLHFQVNVEFQRDIDPSMGELALMRKAIRAKSPPALAPGAMIQLGLIGLTSTYRHPRLSRSER